MVRLDLNDFVYNLYRFGLGNYENGYCHRYPDFEGCTDERISKCLPHVPESEIKKATSVFLRMNYIDRYDAEYYRLLKEAVQKKIIEDFTYIQNNHLHTTFGITFPDKDIFFRNEAPLKEMILKAFNKLWSTSYSWEEYVAVCLECAREEEPVYLREEYRATEKEVLPNSIKYLRLWKEYFSSNKNLFEFQRPHIDPKIEPTYDYRQVVDYLKRYCIDAYKGTPVYDYMLKRSIERPLEEKAREEKKQKAKERQKQLKQLAKRTDI